MYTNDRNAYRQAFYTAWQKHEKKLFLEPAETHIVNVLLQHPEYLSFITKPNLFEQQEFIPEENPFLHLSLHIAIQEQIHMNHPQGIKTIYQQLITQHNDAHSVEHLMMKCLYQMIMLGQQSGAMPSNEIYLEQLRKL